MARPSSSAFLSTDPHDAAEVAGLVYVTDAEPGISRRRRGKGFSYHVADGDAVSDRDRERIDALVIPPAWEDVWICARTNGHLQATGRDERDGSSTAITPTGARSEAASSSTG